MNETFIDTYVLKYQKYLGILGKCEDFQIQIGKGAFIYYVRHRGGKVVQKMAILPYSMYVLTNSYCFFTRYTFDRSCTECSLKLQGWKLHNQCHIISTYTRIIRTYRFSLGADSSNVHLESDQTLTSDDAPPHCALKMSFTQTFLQKQIAKLEV